MSEANRRGMVERLASTPRAVPSRLGPALAGTAVVALALPVVAIAGWSLRGWALAAVLWLALQVFASFLARLPLDAAHNGAAGVRGIGMSLRAVVAGVVLVAATVSDEQVGGVAALVYVLAYTTELAVSLVSFFSREESPA
jgi:hypothetical protein